MSLASPTRNSDGGFPTAALLRAAHISKEFPGVTALDDVNLSIAAGEIMALLGANGAGKSTLIQILAGAHPAGSYAGSLELAGSAFHPNSTAEAELAGVALVPQEINVAPDLSVAENICLNAEPSRWGMIDVSKRLAIAGNALRGFGLNIDPWRPMGSLDLATQQLAMIARALSKDACLLILDEPTAALTESEASQLFERMRAMKARGVAIIFVSHRLAEVFAICDRIVVMRDGRICGDHRTVEISREAVVSEMVGELVSLPRLAAYIAKDPALQVEGLTVSDPETDARLKVDRLNLILHKGEVVGLFGLLGAGCIEAALAIYGAWPGNRAGQIRIDGKPADIRTPRDAVRLGLGLMAQDRRDCLMRDQSIFANIGLASIKHGARWGVLDIASQRRRTTDLVERLAIKARSIDTEVVTLSGGNQQKVQVARWLDAGARILILIDPTRGVDVGARSEIKRIWSDLRDAGHSILIASTDAEELVDVCDRVVVMRSGRVAGELSGSALNERELVRMAADG